MGLFSSESEQESELNPWTSTLPGVLTGVKGITDWMQEPMQYYGGETFVGRTPAEQHYLDALRGGAQAAPGIVASYTEPGMQGWQGMLQAPGSVLGMGLQDVMSNPALTGAADAIQSRVNRNLQENILPSIGRRMAGAGQFGGGRMGVAEGIAGRGTSDVLAEQLANMYGNAWAQGLGAETARYGQALGAQGRALGMMPGLIQSEMGAYTMPADMRLRQGAMQRAGHERELQADIARNEYEQMEPFTRAQSGLNALMPAATAFGEGSIKTESSPSLFSSAGQLLSLGGALYGGGFGFPGFAGGGMPGGTVNPYAMGGVTSTWPGGYGGGYYGGYGADPWGYSSPWGW